MVRAIPFHLHPHVQGLADCKHSRKIKLPELSTPTSEHQFQSGPANNNNNRGHEAKKHSDTWTMPTINLDYEVAMVLCSSDKHEERGSEAQSAVRMPEINPALPPSAPQDESTACRKHPEAALSQRKRSSKVKPGAAVKQYSSDASVPHRTFLKTPWRAQEHPKSPPRCTRHLNFSSKFQVARLQKRSRGKFYSFVWYFTGTENQHMSSPRRFDKQQYPPLKNCTQDV